MVEFPESSVQYSRVIPIRVPIPEKENWRAIRDIDWSRCKRKIKNAQPPSNFKSIIYSTLLGIGASSGLSYLVISQSTDIVPLIKAIYFVGSIFSLVVSGLFYKLDEEERKKFTNELDEVIVDMSDIESLFEVNGKLGKSRASNEVKRR